MNALKSFLSNFDFHWKRMMEDQRAFNAYIATFCLFIAVLLVAVGIVTDLVTRFIK